MANGTCDLVFELIERFEIPCDALRPGFLQASYGGRGRKAQENWAREWSYGGRGRKAQENWAREWSAYGTEVELLDRDGFAALIGSDKYDGGMRDARGGNLQPLSYARGLAKAAAWLGWHATGPAGRSPPRRAGSRPNGW
jgi:sarcosine oxidase